MTGAGVRYLTVTYRHGRPLAGYLYLPRQAGEKSFRTSTAESGLVIDYGAGGNAIGIEITSPTRLTASDLNRVLAALSSPAVDPLELAPLRTA